MNKKQLMDIAYKLRDMNDPLAWAVAEALMYHPAEAMEILFNILTTLIDERKELHQQIANMKMLTAKPWEIK